MHNDSNGFLKPFGFILHPSGIKSPSKVFGKGRQDSEGDWAMRPSVTRKRT